MAKDWNLILEQSRHIADPVADDVVEAIYTKNDLAEINRIFNVMIENDDLPLTEMPPEVQQYLLQTSPLPDWADADKLKLASDVFDAFGIPIVFMLFGASLPVLYAAHPGAEILVATTRMTEQLPRRIVETAQFVMNVTAPNAFDDTGRGIRSTQKVRLMHATIRRFIRNSPEWGKLWNNDHYGLPINQSDLAATMLSFSSVVIGCMKRSAIELSDEQTEAYLHLWKVVGFILGVQEQLIPTDLKEANDLFNTWAKLNHKDTSTGRELTKVLIAFMQQHTPIAKSLPTDWMRYWLGTELSSMLGIPGYNWTVIILWIQRKMWSTKQGDSRNPVLEQIHQFFVRGFLNSLLTIQRGGKRSKFELPSSLTSKAGIGA
ncbi:MAG: oxygenase MpaB family protein [Phototrophicaceae bacterium]